MLADQTSLNPALSDIEAAADRIRGVVNRTPLEHSPWLSEVAGAPVYLKLECMQRTRSFKLRGAVNAVATLSPAQRARGVVTASAGNHGQAIALAAALHGIPAHIFVPAGAPQVKKTRIRSYGAELDDSSVDYDAAEAAAAAFAAGTGRHFVHAFSDPAVVAGQGTIALEIKTDLRDVSDVVVPVGGGGLAAGIGTALRALSPSTSLICVQSDETRAMHDAFAAGRAVSSPITPTIADGLAGCTDQAAFERLRALADRIHLVPERALGPAIRATFESAGAVAEGAGVVGIAALLSGVIEVRGPAVIVVSGGNIDGALFAGLLAS